MAILYVRKGSDQLKEILKALQDQSNQINSQIIQDLLDQHAVNQQHMRDLYARYRAEDLPILDRTFEDENKINRTLNNAFDVEIVDTKVGYFAGYPISYQVDKEQPNAKEADKVIQEFLVRTNMADMDAENVKLSAICGYSGRLLYIDQDGKENAMYLPPWEVIPIYDRSINSLQYAMRYYDITVKDQNETYTITRVEWYDSVNVTFYVSDKNGGNFTLDDTEPTNPQPHMFEEVPIIIFPNNDEFQGDAEKVMSLIDGYDRTFSDVNSEIEQFRLAYMAFYGYTPDEETIAAAKRTGAFGLDDKNETGVEFITKDLNDTIIENHLNRLEANIMRFAKSVNMTDESFAGNLSGVAIKYKLMSLENKCTPLERKMTAALRQQFKILATVWAKKGMAFDYTNIYFSFKRNLPVDITSEADTTSKLKGMVSETTRLSLLSFVDDVENEIEEMEKDNEGAIDLTKVITDEDLPVEDKPAEEEPFKKVEFDG